MVEKQEAIELQELFIRDPGIIMTGLYAERFHDYSPQALLGRPQNIGVVSTDLDVHAEVPHVPLVQLVAPVLFRLLHQIVLG